MLRRAVETRARYTAAGVNSSQYLQYSNSLSNSLSRGSSRRRPGSQGPARFCQHVFLRSVEARQSRFPANIGFWPSKPVALRSSVHGLRTESALNGVVRRRIWITWVRLFPVGKAAIFRQGRGRRWVVAMIVPAMAWFSRPDVLVVPFLTCDCPRCHDWLPWSPTPIWKFWPLITLIRCSNFWETRNFTCKKG